MGHSGRMSEAGDLVTIKTRVPRDVADALGAAARAADRSVAAELRRAIYHYTRCTNDFSDARKDGR